MEIALWPAGSLSSMALNPSTDDAAVMLREYL